MNRTAINVLLSALMQSEDPDVRPDLVRSIKVLLAADEGACAEVNAALVRTGCGHPGQAPWDGLCSPCALGGDRFAALSAQAQAHLAHGGTVSAAACMPPCSACGK